MMVTLVYAVNAGNVDVPGLSSRWRPCWCPRPGLPPKDMEMSGVYVAPWIYVDVHSPRCHIGPCYSSWSILLSEAILMCLACATAWSYAGVSGPCGHWGLCCCLWPLSLPMLMSMLPCYHQRSWGCLRSVLPPEAIDVSEPCCHWRPCWCFFFVLLFWRRSQE